MKRLLATASVFTLALISAVQTQGMNDCLTRHDFDTCHYALNR